MLALMPITKHSFKNINQTITSFIIYQLVMISTIDVVNKNKYLSCDWSRGGSRPLSLSISRQTVTVVRLAVKFPCRVNEKTS